VTHFVTVIAFDAAWSYRSCNIVAVLDIVGHFLQKQLGAANYVTREPVQKG
jgi:hypothetical protein